jgi:DNA-binding response OmpR family regulator
LSHLIELLQRTDALRAALLSSVSHDLRTPLTAIKASASSLLQEDVQWDEEVRRGFASSIEREADRLNRLVGNLLDLSRIEDGALKPDKDYYPLSSLMYEVLDRMQSVLQGRVVQIELPTDLPPVELDYVMMDQVLTNLIENAVRYTPPTSPIEIGVQRVGDEMHLCVADRGPGIAPADRERIFDKFYTARAGDDAVRTTLQHRPDLILLDLLLPGMSGIEVCQRIREHSNVPIIVLSAKEKERDKIEALDQGADDYIQKPFGMNEVLARIRVALRHVANMQAGTEPQVQVGSLRVDFSQRRVQRDGHIIDLTPTEYDLLKILLTHRGKILTRQMLLQNVWGAQAGTRVHSLHVYVANLRQKIEPNPLHPCFLLTVPGVGYRFNEEVPEE